MSRSMRGRGRARPVPRGNAAADLLVCFPPRAHLTLMPKPICSPARGAADQSSRRHHPKATNRGQSSPLFRSKSRPPAAAEIAEPTSPKVTCAGQVKIKSKQGSCTKNWQSVMEEIEKIHGGKKARKESSNWIHGLGFKKDVINFMACLRGLRFNMRCFSSFPGAVGDSDSSIDEEEEGEDGQEDYLHQNQEDAVEQQPADHSRAVFSKWLMILQENQHKGVAKDEEGEVGGGSCTESSLPPKNALLLMRCRSAPAKSWLEKNQEEEEAEKVEEEKKQQEAMLKDDKDEKENFILKNYAPDFLKMSTDIAKETWVVGRSEPFSRSRSWK